MSTGVIKYIAPMFLAVVVLLQGCGGSSERNENTAGAKRTALPKFKYIAQNGREFTQKDFQKGVGVISFVASWCRPCDTELVQLDSLARKFPKILALAVTYEPPEFYREIFDSLGLNIPLVKADSSFFAVLGVSQLPTRVLVRNGNVVYRLIGAPTPQDSIFIAKLSDALGILNEKRQGK